MYFTHICRNSLYIESWTYMNHTFCRFQRIFLRLYLFIIISNYVSIYTSVWWLTSHPHFSFLHLLKTYFRKLRCVNLDNDERKRLLHKSLHVVNCVTTNFLLLRIFWHAKKSFFLRKSKAHFKVFIGDYKI